MTTCQFPAQTPSVATGAAAVAHRHHHVSASASAEQARSTTVRRVTREEIRKFLVRFGRSLTIVALVGLEGWAPHHRWTEGATIQVAITAALFFAIALYGTFWDRNPPFRQRAEANHAARRARRDARRPARQAEKAEHPEGS
jgi:hypothetical protein